MADDNDTAADNRERAALRREDAADKRNRDAHERDSAADERDSAATTREHVADERDSVADQRDSAADRRDSATEARDDAALRTEARLMEAQEVHDTVVQGLTVAKYALDRGDAEAASEAIRDTLSRAREVITGLLDEAAPQPGELRRSTPALGEPARTAS